MKASPSVPDNDSKEGRDFAKLVLWVSTISIAVMAGFLGSIKQVNPALQFRLSAASAIAFLAGGVLSFLFLRFILAGNAHKRGLLVVAVAILCVLGYFAIGIKDVLPENRRDVTLGTAIAVAVLSFVAFLIWRVGKFFEDDQSSKDDQ